MSSLTDRSPADLAAAADTNLVTHAGWVQGQTQGMHLIVAPDVVLIDSGLPSDTFNLVCQSRFASYNALDRIRRVIGYFAEVGRPFAWWLSPGYTPPDLWAVLLAAGLHPAETEVAMVADLAALRPGDVAPGGLQIRRVQTAAQLRDFAQVVAANWTPADPQVPRFYERATSVLLTRAAPLWLYVGYLDGAPVAASELTVGGGVVGLYNVCTLAAYRRRGFGTALTLQPLRDARAQGHDTAVLQASTAGEGVYARLGFSSFGQVTEYKPSLPPTADR